MVDLYFIFYSLLSQVIAVNFWNIHLVSLFKALANLVTEKDLNEGRLYPSLNSIGDVSLKLAVKVRQSAHTEQLEALEPVKLYFCKPYRSWNMPMDTTWPPFAQSHPTRKAMCARSSTALNTMTLLWTRTAGQRTAWLSSHANFDVAPVTRLYKNVPGIGFSQYYFLKESATFSSTWLHWL